MSLPAALAKLQDPLRSLVAGSAEAGAPSYGQSEKDQAEVAEWIEKISTGEIVKAETLKVCVIICMRASRLEAERATLSGY